MEVLGYSGDIGVTVGVLGAQGQRAQNSEESQRHRAQLGQSLTLTEQLSAQVPLAPKSLFFQHLVVTSRITLANKYEKKLVSTGHLS